MTATSAAAEWLPDVPADAGGGSFESWLAPTSINE